MRALLIAVAGLLATPTIAAEADSKEAVRAFVDKVNEAAMNFFATGSEQDAREKCRALLVSAFALPEMAEYALARAWTKATGAQREELLQAFEEDVISGYLRRMRSPGTTLAYIGERPPIDGHQLAASRRVTPGKPDETWIWEMRPDGQSWRIVDLYVDGHSALSTERQEYGTVYENNNGDINAVIEFMRKRAAR